MSKRVITISREFGSGGRTIGKTVADQLGVAYYDKELVKKLAVESGLDEHFIEEEGEAAPGRSLLSYSLAARGMQGALNGMTIDDFLWTVQNKIVMELAEKEPCVIVGRCADFILRERDDCLHVFIHADKKARADRVVRLYGETDKKIEKRLEDKDRKRKTYYRNYTDLEWGMSQNYHLSLDSSFLGVEKCGELIVGIAKN